MTFLAGRDLFAASAARRNLSPESPFFDGLTNRWSGGSCDNIESESRDLSALSEGVISYLDAANVAMAVSLVGARDSILEHVNPRFCRLTGYDPNDVVGHNCRFMQGHLSHQPGVQAVRRFMADPTARRMRAHLINFRADETPFVNQLTLHRITSPGGIPRLILSSQFDITAAAPSEVLDYHAELAEVLRARMTSRDEREILIGSVQSMGEAAAAIAQAKFLMDEADRAGMLGI